MIPSGEDIPAAGEILCAWMALPRCRFSSVSGTMEEQEPEETISISSPMSEHMVLLQASCSAEAIARRSACMATIFKGRIVSGSV